MTIKPQATRLNDPAVLVAEDNPAVRSFVERSLQTDAFLVTTASDGQKALDLLTENTFDVLVTDIVMPNVDGIALVVKAMRLHPSLRVVMISGYAQERMRAHHLDNMVHRVVAKPFSMDEIRQAVRDALTAEPMPLSEV